VSFETRSAEHTPFEVDVTRALRASGFHVTSPAYHEYMPREIISRLKTLDTPTTELARMGADLFAVHDSLPLALFVEVKTHKSTRYHDLTAEARQFVQRVEEASCGSMCLYCYRDPGVREVGFWMHQCPPVREVRIPARWGDAEIKRWEWRFSMALDGVRMIQTENTNGGSDTPFVVIDEAALRGLPDWREQIADVVGQTSMCYPDSEL
jgi:hypothetical protein